jgi:hypothetical protein
MVPRKPLIFEEVGEAGLLFSDLAEDKLIQKCSGSTGIIQVLDLFKLTGML